MSVASRSSTICSGASACDSMNRSQSSASIFSGSVIDLVVTLRAAGKFQPVQRALAGQGIFQLAPARQHGHQRIVAQLLMIVQVLVAQRQPVDALREHLGKLVLRPAAATAGR
jgi:hypothetical protein